MKLESVLESTSDAVISIGRDHRILSWNRGAEKMLGYSAAEALAMEVMQIIPPRFRERHVSGVERFVATQIPHAIGQTVELAALHRDGHEFPIELTLSNWQEGDEVLFAGIIRDITGRKAAETAVRASEQRLKSITGSTADAIISINPQNKILTWNKGAEQLLGYTAEEIIDSEIMQIIPERFRDRHLKGLARFVETRIPHAIGTTVELAALHRDGHEFPIELTLSTWEEGGAPMFTGIIRDITARKKAEADLETERLLLKRERDRTEELLLNILPISIAKELQYTGKVETREFKDVTVLFADFVGFTRLSEAVSGIDLVGELDYYFRSFDAIVGKYRLEKIKTIGDAYMCASGLPEEDGSCVMDCVMAALEMVRTVQIRNRERPPLERWQLRIGLNSGSVIAGIVGDKKFVYDIWGNTVNLASRIESYGIANRVCVSDNTRQRIGDFFEFEALGSIELKNIGRHESFAIRSFRKDLSRDGRGNSPAPEFFEMCRKTHGCAAHCIVKS